jgi:hypothetical protein
MAGGNQQGKPVQGVGQATPDPTDEERQAAEAEAAKDEPDQAEKREGGPRRWIADTFEGVVYVHNVDGAGTSRVLAAGDEIPAGHEDKVRSHIPTTTSQPRSSRLREFDSTLSHEGAPAPTFDPRDHTVPQVNEYLQAYPEDVQRVLDLERSGAARIGVLKRD